MVFSSLIFLFFFFPLTMLLYLLMGIRFRNPFLFCASLFFYAWGEGFYVGVMLISICINWAVGLLIDRYRSTRASMACMIAGIVFNLAMLAYFKYWNFFVENASLLLSGHGFPSLETNQVHLPIGISFFTFQAITYIVDIYKKQGCIQRNPLDVGLYISLFPQLIAGPIVRYRQISASIESRVVGIDGIATGVERFTLGLGKKVLIANNVALITDKIFSLPLNTLPAAVAWAGIAGYTVQIYFDFSGYSDMAIGIGHMLGFKFPENFKTPYSTSSIREFWQRWHITLSSWFRDYLYIPIGGNRKGLPRTCLNLFIVFFLCGLWHGAGWGFIVWGLWHGLFLSLERTMLLKTKCVVPFVLRHTYVLLVVMIGWVFFRTSTVGNAFLYLKAMAGTATAPDPSHMGLMQNPVFVISLALGCLFSFVQPQPFKFTARQIKGSEKGYLFVLFSILILSIISLSSGVYNPFIYFRF